MTPSRWAIDHKKKRGTENRTYVSTKPGLANRHADAAASGEMGMDISGCEEVGNGVLLRGWWCGWEWDAGMQAASPQQVGTSQLPFAAPENVVQGGKRATGDGKGFGVNWSPRWSKSDFCKRWEPNSPHLNPSKVLAPGDVGQQEHPPQLPAGQRAGPTVCEPLAAKQRPQGCKLCFS